MKIKFKIGSLKKGDNRSKISLFLRINHYSHSTTNAYSKLNLQTEKYLQCNDKTTERRVM